MELTWIEILSTALAAVVATGVGATAFFRRVVPTNEVHIVQSRRKTTSYGKDQESGNTYFAWPSWAPFIGITRSVLPVSVFDLDLQKYEAYDSGRLPFVVDVKAFFRISDSNVAAQRVASFEELHSQLKAVVQGSVRSILANSDIHEIMQGRAKFGTEFTKAVESQLASWGVSTVKTIELMDLRDSDGSHVINNIMAKKKSHIEMESRIEVAKNMQDAQIAEINAKQQTDLQAQAAQQAVGLRTVENQQAVSIKGQVAAQAIKDQERVTAEKTMEVARVNAVKTAEITKQVNITAAEQQKETAVLAAEGQLQATKLTAEGVTATGTAKAAAEKAMQLAPIQAQIELAKEIGANAEYQKYLVTIRQVEANQVVGVKQAEALTAAQIKIICNSGNPVEGTKNVMELFTAKGGTSVGAALEGLAMSEKGQQLLTKLGFPNGSTTLDGLVQ